MPKLLRKDHKCKLIIHLKLLKFHNIIAQFTAFVYNSLKGYRDTHSLFSVNSHNPNRTCNPAPLYVLRSHSSITDTHLLLRCLSIQPSTSFKTLQPTRDSIAKSILRQHLSPCIYQLPRSFESKLFLDLNFWCVLYILHFNL